MDLLPLFRERVNSTIFFDHQPTNNELFEVEVELGMIFYAHDSA